MPGLVPPIPQRIDVRVGVRWIGVSWRPDPTSPPIESYRLIIRPGSRILEMSPEENWLVLTSAPPGRSYTFAVAAVGSGGRGPWRSAPPVWLTDPFEPQPALHAVTFSELLQMGDGPLAHLLEEVDDEDLLVALECAPVPVRRRLLEVVLPPDRGFDLARRLGQAGQIARTSLSDLDPAPAPLIPVDPRNAPPEIVVESTRSRSLFAAAPWVAMAGLLALILYLSLRPPVVEQSENREVVATVEALVATRLASVDVEEGAALQITPLPLTQSIPSTPPDGADPTAIVLKFSSALPLTKGNGERPIVARPEVDQLNLRIGPDEDFAALERLALSSELTPLARSVDERWLFVDTGERTGWVARWLVIVDGDEDSLPYRVIPTPPSVQPSPTVVLAQVVPESTPVAQPTARLVSTLSTRVATVRPTEAPASAPTQVVNSSTRCGIVGNFWLIEPVDKAVHNLATFRWGYSVDLPEGCGFEIRLWRPGEGPRGVHDAVRDNRSGAIRLTQQNEYRLEVPYLHDLPSVNGRSGDYLWTVALVAIEPGYEDLGIQAAPARVWMDPQP